MTKKLVGINELKVGRFIIIDDIACKVVDIQTSRPGKHGHAKCRLTAVGLTDNQKRIIVKPGHDKVEVPIIEKKDAQVLSVQGDMVSVMDMETYDTFDLKVPDELKDLVKEGIQIIYWIILGEKVLKQIK